MGRSVLSSSFAISWPCFRLRGAFFSLATLVFPIAMEIIANNWTDITRGSSGIALPFKPGFENFIFRSRWAYLAAAFVLMMIVYGITRWIHRGRLGLSLIATRDDQAAAESMGVQPVKDVVLIRHAYVRPAAQGQGVGGKLLAHLTAATSERILIGTWAAAWWAIGFYRRNGFTLVSPDD